MTGMSAQTLLGGPVQGTDELSFRLYVLAQEAANSHWR